MKQEYRENGLASRSISSFAASEKEIPKSLPDKGINKDRGVRAWPDNEISWQNRVKRRIVAGGSCGSMTATVRSRMMRARARTEGGYTMV